MLATGLEQGVGNDMVVTFDCTLGLQKRMSRRFSLQANYTFTHAIDDVLNSTLASEIQNGEA